MFKKLLALFGVGLAVTSTPAMARPYEPYAKATSANEIYDLLFCDNYSAFQPRLDSKPADWQLLLFGPSQDPAEIARLAQDPATESRLRALAYNWLHAHGRETPKGVVLGVVIEVPLDQGLDVLAAYADGSVRYINQTGKMAIVEPGGSPEVSTQAKQLIELAQPIVARIGPWDKGRMPPPARPNIRLTFVVSDGLYFGEGPFKVMQQDGVAGPLIQQAAHLLTLITAKVVARPTP